MNVSNRVDVDNLLSQMRELKAQAQGPSAIQPRSTVEEVASGGKVQGARPPEFMDMFENAINAVNETQKQSGALSKAYQMGDPGVTLTQVMVASEKAGVSFQALTQVRNKLVEAYKDVMNMPI